MRALLLTVVLLICAARAAAQEPQFQTGHTHDILTVKFSPDDRQLSSFSAGDGRLCLWDVRTFEVVRVFKTAEKYKSASQKEFRGDRVEDYGEPVVLKFKGSDLPPAGREKIPDG